MSSSKENLITLLNEITQQTKFQVTQSQRLLMPSELRAEYDRRRLSGLGPSLYPEANIPASRLTALVREIRPVLKPYMDSKEKYVSTVPMPMIRFSYSTSIEELTQELVVATAMLGAKRVVQLFFGWIAGKPVDYQEKSLLSGVKIDASLALEEGIRVNRLPSSSTDLFAHVSPSMLRFRGAGEFLRGVVLSVDSRVGPVFSKPVNDNTRVEAEYDWRHERIAGGWNGAFCEALSLACNHCIRQSFGWMDYGEISRFYPQDNSCGFVKYEISSSGPTKLLTQEDLERARDIYLVRKDAGKTLNLDIAIHRWIKSKWPDTNFEDRLIDLRIALENLLLKDNSGEKGFRLAVYGAWYLGCDPDKRCQYFSMLRGVYSLASKAVHAGAIKPDPKNHTLLADAQKLCRDIIVKMLREKHAPDWDKIIFGAQAV